MNKFNLTHEFCGICYISSLVRGREPHVFHLDEQVPTQFRVEIEERQNVIKAVNPLQWPQVGQQLTTGDKKTYGCL